MSGIKTSTKNILRAIGLYDVTHRLYERRPNLRVMCWNAGFRLTGAGDGLPLPPTRYIHLVTTGRVVCHFLYEGGICRECILYALRKNSYSINDFKAILDFGCGCGRVMRHWKSLKGPRLYGTDYNPELIKWCQKNLSGLAEFSRNNLKPPFTYANEMFDFIYAISVFTHLTGDLQFAWMEELKRVLKPNGLILISVHGESRLHQLSKSEQQQFLSGQLVVKNEGAAGSNICGAYHPREYVDNVLAKAYEVVDHIEVGGRDTDQDLYLLRKPVIMDND